MKRLLIAIAALTPLSVLSADPTGYYRVDEKLARDIAREKTASIADADTRIVREHSVIEAFTELFRTARVKDGDVKKILSALSERDMLADSLSRMRKVLEEREAALGALTDTAAADPATTQMHNDIAHLKSRIEKARAELDIALATARADSASLVTARALTDSMRAHVSVLQAENQRREQNDDVRKTVEDEIVLEEIRSAMAVTDGLAAWDEGVFTAAAGKFARAATRIAATRPAEVKSVADSVALYERDVVPASAAVKDAEACMAAKYDDGGAKRIAAEMASVKASAAKSRMLKPHLAEIDEVAAAAADYERAWRNLNFMIGQLNGMVKEAPAGFRTDEFIATVVGVYSPGATRYSDYYVNFNRALDFISRNFHAGMTDDEAAEFFDSINAQIKK
ncbi:MAG: hypothetical protein HDR83_01905 [Bacteroides sp.]|nr:hypothetical protein [Bacteroides sp.]